MINATTALMLTYVLGALYITYDKVRTPKYTSLKKVTIQKEQEETYAI